jgi:hypothetical protein
MLRIKGKNFPYRKPWTPYKLEQTETDDTLGDQKMTFRSTMAIKYNKKVLPNAQRNISNPL